MAAQGCLGVPALVEATPRGIRHGIGSSMKATIERATLLRCLSHVQSVVERRNTIPILSNVLIEAGQDGTLRVMATDLDLQVVEHMQAVSVEAPGAITVSAHLLFDIARKLPDGSQVSLQTADNRMVVKAGRSRFQLPTLPRDDFPVIVEGDLPTSFELPAATLAQLIDHGLQPIEKARQIGPPDIAPVDHPERNDQILPCLCGDFVELIGRPHQIEMQTSNRQRQRKVEVVAKFAEIRVQHDLELRDRFGKCCVSSLQRVLGAAIKIEHQTWLVQLRPLGAPVGQFTQHIDINR